MEYAFQAIEQKWKKFWEENNTYRVSNNSDKPKFYILDMFPYPSGAGLHVGHPLGYIASDIYARYKRLKGYNVLHPMGFDAFGLPAEQYALETGQHPVNTTEKNIARYKEQLDNIGFCYDWSREVRTSDKKYYRWTQWIFLQLFNSYFDRQLKKAVPIDSLVAVFEKEGNANHPCPDDENTRFDAAAWNAFSEKEQQDILMNYRLAFCGLGEVNWCEALGTVLANDEVVNGVSERGGHPVVKKKLRQWYLRITEYADRLLEGLQTVDFSDAMKEMQGNWIGKSVGAEIKFAVSRDLTPALSKGEGVAPEESSGYKTPGWNTADPSTYHSIKDFKKELKNNLTEAEDTLWQLVRNNQLGAKFRRQHVIGKYIVDFVCLPKKLVIEVDGEIHAQQQEDDAMRTAFLEENGFTVIRFTNENVITKTEEVIETIKQCLNNAETSIHDKHSFGAKVPSLGGDLGEVIAAFTTRPDTIFGVDFMVLAPEHELVESITTDEQRTQVEEYIGYVKSRSERERMAEKKISGCFTGSYAIHPFTGRQIPVWISEYVLAGYGTGAIMAVPCGDERDHKFAKHFQIPVTNIIGEKYNGQEAYEAKDFTLVNSDFINGLSPKAGAAKVVERLVTEGIGEAKVNFKMRDAAFSRQRYWGEPFPIIWKNGIAYPLSEDQLPLELPHVDSYGPGPDGEGPLANIESWKAGHYETNTMPGYAGSSWYFLRYMDPHNEHVFADRAATDYWNQVDIYIGGTEHAVGHLLYSRMWTKALHDLGFISFDEPFKKLVNQGMIQGSSRFVYRIDFKRANLRYNYPVFISKDKIDEYFEENSRNIHPEMVFKDVRRLFPDLIIPGKENHEIDFIFSKLPVDVGIVNGLELDIERFKEWKPEFNDAKFILNNNREYICGAEVEKMSKSKYNVVNPDDIVAQYGADSFRMYEMFLGPIDVSKPWDTKGIEGVHRFLKKYWRLYNDEQKGFVVEDVPATDAELRILHKTIKKSGEDIERFSFNTAVSQFMICVNDLTALNCHKKEILQPLSILLAPFAPHVAEELWHQLGNAGSVLDATFPKTEEKYLAESSKMYPVAINGKTRIEMEFPLDAEQSAIEKEVLADETVIKWLEGKLPKKFIFVKGKMINVVV